MGGRPLEFHCPICQRMASGQQGLRDHLRFRHQIYHAEFDSITVPNPALISYYTDKNRQGRKIIIPGKSPNEY